MTDNSSELVCKFTGEIEQQDGKTIVQIPDAEIAYGTLSAGDIVRMSVERVDHATSESAKDISSTPAPPVQKGDRLTVDIEDRGDQGDGIARVDRGYVLIVPETLPGDTVDVKVSQTNPNYGFAQLVDDEHTRDQEVDL